MENGTLNARRYAQAFLNLFALSSTDMQNVAKAIHFLDTHREIFSLLKVPLLDPQIKLNALTEYLLGQFSLPATFEKLISVLLLQKRTYLIQNVLKEMIELYEEKKGIETFIITSAGALDPNDMEKIEQFLARHTHHTIVCVQEEDKRLIAGIRMQSNYHVWEYSIRKRLAAIEYHNLRFAQ